MNTPIHLQQLFAWLLNRSWQAGALVLCVLLVQLIFRRSLANHWRFALWWIVLARLVLPFGPASQLSLFNCFRPLQSSQIVQEQSPAPLLTAIAGGGAAENPVPPQTASSQPLLQTKRMMLPAPSEPTAEIASKSLPVPERQPRPPITQKTIFAAALACWLAGAIALTAFVLAQVFGMTRRLSRSAMPADARASDLLNDCRHEMRVSRKIELLETDAVKSPALFGLFRLRLLLPHGLSASFNRDELRYIFLHELAHVRRGDLWLNCLVTMLQIFHWFNPLLWLGFARLRADRELACDELVLRQTGEKAAEAYGLTIIKLLQDIQRPAAIPGIVGILEDKNQMRRRISRIAGFKMPKRWSALAVLLVAGLGLVALTDAKQEKTMTRPDLTGTVETEGGQPKEGTVFIYTAGPKVGTSTFCPSCYADCQKHATANAQGKFEIKSLDPQLHFQILAVAPGYKPKFVSRVDPAKGPVTIRLAPIELATAPSGNCLHGCVVDTNGTAIAGAEVDTDGIRMFNGGGGWGQLDGVDPLAVTDDKGKFLITSLKPFDMMDVIVRARGYADKKFIKLASGNEIHQLTLTMGAAIGGRVLFNGKPLANVEIGISTEDVTVNSSSSIVHLNIGTDSNGRFLFINLPPNVDYDLCGTMDSLARFGAIPTRVIHSGDDGSVTDVADLIVTPGHHLTGRVVLADGKPLPPKTQLFIGRDQAWDSIQVELPPDGSFALNNVPAEAYDLGVQVPGYELSPKNSSYDTMNPGRLIGRVDADTTNLMILLEHRKAPAPQQYENDQSEWPQNQPLAGVGGDQQANHSHDLALSGRVTDAQTGEPLAQFSAMPGEERLPFNQITWDNRNATTGTNGVYTVYFDRRWSQPVIKIQADGYLPQSVTVTPLEQTNADFALQKGTGPGGIVRLPDGKPAAGADVLLICPDAQNPTLNSDGHLALWPPQNDLLFKTDRDGHFAFDPKIGMRGVAAASPAGFAQVPASYLTTNDVIVLQPYGSVKGRLERSNGPGANEDLDVAFVGSAPVSQGQIWIENSAHTDPAGHFQFARVPAGALQLTYRMPGSYNSWQNVPLQQITVEPGQNLIIHINAPARQTATFGSPTPPPVQVPGQNITGTVSLPDGTPAANAQVALEITGQLIQLGRASLISYEGWKNGFVARADQNGNFSLPMYKGAEGVVIVSDGGFAHETIDALEQSPRIILEPWARVEGTLRVGRHLGANQIVQLYAYDRHPAWKINSPPPLVLDPNAYETKTDVRGHFILTYIPPGTCHLAREVPGGNGNAWTSIETLGAIELKPGETKRLTIGGNGRTVVGKVDVGPNAPEDWQKGHLFLQSVSAIKDKLKQVRTQEQRMKIIQSPEYQNAMLNVHNYPATLLPDGSFTAEDVLPGKYEIYIQSFKLPSLADPRPENFTYYTLANKPLSVPAPTGTNDTPVDFGMISLKAVKLPVSAQNKVLKDLKSLRVSRE